MRSERSEVRKIQQPSTKRHNGKLTVTAMNWAGYLLVAPLWIGILLSQAPVPPAALDEAAAAFEQGRADEADQKLNAVLKSHPADLRALLLKAAVLDSLERWGEAEGYYQRALKQAPHSAQALNNAANHYLASGDRSRARQLFLKAVANDPHHVNANLQLAQMSVEEKTAPRLWVT